MATKKRIATIALEDVKVGDQLELTATVTLDKGEAIEGGTLTFSKGTVQAGDGYTEEGSKATITKLEKSKAVTVKADYTTVDGDKPSVTITADFEGGGITAQGKTEAISVSEAV